MTVPEAAVQAGTAEWLRRVDGRIVESPDSHVREILAAAAPVIGAQALRDAADWLGDEFPYGGDTRDAYVAALRERADDIEAQR